MANMTQQREPAQADIGISQKIVDFIWRGGANAIEQVRQEIVDRGWFGRHPHQEVPEQGSVWGPASKDQAEAQVEGDPMGRTAPEALSTEDRYAFAEAYERHLEVGPSGAAEMENYWNWAEQEGLVSDGMGSAEAARDHDASRNSYEIQRDEMER